MCLKFPYCRIILIAKSRVILRTIDFVITIFFKYAAELKNLISFGSLIPFIVCDIFLNRLDLLIICIHLLFDLLIISRICDKS